MKKKKLLSGQDAVPAKCQHTTPCSDCPWARDALPGWLGTLSPQDWISLAHSESTAECHVMSGVHCAGLAIYRANVGKMLRDPTVPRLEKDKSKVFASIDEFLEHHLPED